ncbi:filamentous haemagglutinin family protein [Oleiharenicola lentus]|uniref:filamentous haemagglutinin family protein n=1 Tax=Oleiharenicola lentus TaxID=2508720 RepID=UPI003F66BAA7
MTLVALVSAMLVFSPVHAIEIQRPTARVPVSTPARPIVDGADAAQPAPSAPIQSAQQRLARTDQALQAVRAMQAAARNLALAGPNKLRPDLPDVPVNSYLQPGGLVPASAGPRSPWTGANQPTAVTQTAGGTTTSTVTVTQTAQQALLTWQSFNIGKNTTLVFDQSAGAANASQWIAFNYIRDPSGNPTQILGALKTIGPPDAKGGEQVGGQIYVLNANGILFGGSSQVNTHGLVASSLPINYNLIQRGLLNNPDAQFLFSALPQNGGGKGPTGAFDPAVASETGLAPEQTSFAPGGVYGDVIVQAGAQLTAPTTADKVGGRVALLGPNVTQAGTVSTEDGQTIIAAGLEVGFSPHRSSDPTLRGLDVFVGKIASGLLSNQPSAGRATIAGLDAPGVAGNTAFSNPTTNPGGLNALGLINAPRGSVYVTGAQVQQAGVIESSTSVSYNGRVDLVAGYNAVANPKYDPSVDATADFTVALPFYYQSHVGNDPTAAAVANAGAVTFGAGSVLRIMPELGSEDEIAGDLSLPSQVNVQGSSIYFAKDATLLAPGASVPKPLVLATGGTVTRNALGADGASLGAGVSLRAGSWFNPGSTAYRFVHSAGTQQIYLSTGSVVDVAGLTEVAASVTDNIVTVELRGTEVADSPVQRDGPLRGKTIQVDVRQHGEWDQTLNNGFGGYTWVGTRLADTAGWIGLATHTVGQLSVDGGSVSLQAGGPVVVQTGATVDVSGGFIDYAGGVTRTTQMTANGHLYSIGSADPTRVYDGVYDGKTTASDNKWGVTTTHTDPLSLGGVFEQGYRQGGNGGSLAITAPVVALDGSFRGTTLEGPLQRSLAPNYQPANPPNAARPSVAGVNNWLLTTLSRPVASQFSLTVGRSQLADIGGNFDFRAYSPNPADIVIRSGSTLPKADNYNVTADYLFPTQRDYRLDLDPVLFSATGGGFGIVSIDNRDDDTGESAEAGSITGAAGTTVSLAPAGSLSLLAGNVTVQQGATISAPGGSIRLEAYGVSTSAAAKIALERSVGAVEAADLPKYDATRGNISIATGARLTTAGLLVDDSARSAEAGTSPLATAGGAIALSGNDVTLATGSVLDVSGGAQVTGANKISYANAGSIALTSGRALGSGFGAVLGGDLSLGAELRGYAGTGRNGGSLSIQAPSVRVGALNAGVVNRTDATNGQFLVAPEFFNQGGFAAFSLTSLGVTTGRTPLNMPSFWVTANTVVAPQVRSWTELPGGGTFLAPEGVRRAARLTFRAGAALQDANGLDIFNDTGFVLGGGAVVRTDPRGSVTFGGGNVELLGRVETPGGTITVTQGGDSRYLFTPGLHLGGAAVLNAAGAITYSADATGYRATDVAAGGTIALTGNIVAERGAVLDVSGAAGKIWVAAAEQDPSVAVGVAGRLTEVEKASDGGRITLQAERMLFTDATLRGAGGRTAGGLAGQGGELIVDSQRSDYDLSAVRPDGSTRTKPSDVVLSLTASAPVFVYAGIGNTIRTGAGAAFGDQFGLGLIWFGADRFTSGNFGSLQLSVGSGATQVHGNVALTVSRQIAVADGGVLSWQPETVNGNVVPATLAITAPYVAIGSPFLAPTGVAPSNPFGQGVAPTTGEGRLTVTASSLIDVGSLLLRGANQVTLDATAGGTTAGAIRGNGQVVASADLTLKAGQVYAPTATDFSITTFDRVAPDATVTASRVTIAGAPGALPALPLSAGGSLSIYASEIDQGGVLRAPLGWINLGDNSGGVEPISGLALPTTSRLTIAAGSVTSVSAVDPLTGQAMIVPYGINLNGEAWIDPAGVDITNIGPNAKSITLSANTVDLQAASGGRADALIDLGGGGELLAYRFVPGAGGTRDTLGATSGAFAILPGDATKQIAAYADHFAPFAPFNRSSDALLTLGSDPGYVVANAALNYSVGDRIHLAGGGDLPAGDYTLLPARYALLPGAYLVTPTTNAATAGPAANAARTDGSVVVSGYRFNGFDPAGRNQSVYARYEIAPQKVALARSRYENYEANKFFTDVATNADAVAPRLPMDAGRLSLLVGTGLSLRGAVKTGAATGGRGGLVDIASPNDIVIATPAVAAAAPLGTVNDLVPPPLVLDATELSAFGAASLLVGGVRTETIEGTIVSVVTDNLKVDNAGAPLAGTDVILVANKTMEVAANAEIGRTGQTAVAGDDLILQGRAELGLVGDTLDFTRGGVPILLPQGTPGNGRLTSTSAGVVTLADGSTVPFLATTPLLANAFTVPAGASITLNSAGTIKFSSSTDTVVRPVTFAVSDGVMVRAGSVTSNLFRTDVAGLASPTLTIGAGARTVGASVVLDSTQRLDLAPNLSFGGTQSIALASGAISVRLDANAAPAIAGSLDLGPATLTNVLGGARSLQLVSYSSLDLLGTGTLGSANLEALRLNAGVLRGDLTGKVTLQAKTVSFGNVAGVTPPPASTVAPVSTGELVVAADQVELTYNSLAVRQFAHVTINATAALTFLQDGALNVANGALAVTTPLISGAASKNYALSADGAMTLRAPTSAGKTTIEPGLGARLSLAGGSVDIGTKIALPSGSLAVTATTGNVSVLAAGALDVAGTSQQFYDLSKFTDGGSIALTAEKGNVVVAAKSSLSVSAPTGGGSAGDIAIAAPLGTVTLAAGTLVGRAGSGGEGGSFSLDASAIPASATNAANSLSALTTELQAGGFARAQEFRVRTGDVLVDGKARAHTFAVAADAGDIRVTGSIDASGFTGASASNVMPTTFDPSNPAGGVIQLSAAGDVVLAAGSWLSAAGYAFDNAGQGGRVNLSAGAYTHNGTAAQFDQAARVDVQAGAQIDLGVKNRFTVEDMFLAGGGTVPVSTRPDFATGVLHIRESLAAFGSGAQFAALGDRVNGASSIVLEGFRVFDVSLGNGLVTTSGSVTRVGSGGLIDTAVKREVLNNGTAFLAGVDAGLLADTRFQVRPGAEIVNHTAATGAITHRLVTMTRTTGVMNFSLKPGVGIFTNVAIPGGLPTGVGLRPTTGRQYTLTFADGTTSALTTANASTTIASTSDTNPVIAVNFRNAGATALSTAVTYVSGSGAFTVALTPDITLGTLTNTVLTTALAGDLTLANTWDLAAYKFGAAQQPGYLTLRAANNLVFTHGASLSDGFDATKSTDVTMPLWTAPLLRATAPVGSMAVPAGLASWSYRLVGGADYTSADSREVQAISKIGATNGMVVVGNGGPALPTTTAGTAVARSVIIPQFFQTIRTGSGDIEVAAARDVRLLNPLATIYTAGRAVANPASVAGLNDFDLPLLNVARDSVQALQPYGTAQYSQGGGDVLITAQGDIARYILNGTVLRADSSKGLPSNWLYRRGTVGSDGRFAALLPVGTSLAPTTEIQSTSWWVDFSNFFGDVGALGGGHVSLAAGRDISNVNAASPTNARMPGKSATGTPLAPNLATLVELGGGDVRIAAGRNIDGGIYYAEHGAIDLQAGGEITTNATRSAFGNNGRLPITWLPTTIFLGKGEVSVAAAGDVRMGQVANLFWLPQGANNRAYEKTYFTTFHPGNTVDVSSLGGDVFLQGRPDSSSANSVGSAAWLGSWYGNVLSSATTAAAAPQPWLRLNVTSGSAVAAILPFQTVASVQPATLRATAFGGDITVSGTLTLAPSPTGTIDLLAAGNLNGIAENGASNVISVMGSAVINLSDASPARLPGLMNPISFSTYTPTTSLTLLNAINALFAESGKSNFSLEEKLALHGTTPNAQGVNGPLHAADSRPVHLYAADGDISGLTLYSAKSARVVAEHDITDIALYVQNVRSTDTTVVMAGRDLVAYAPASPLRLAAQQPGNLLPGTAGDTGAGTGNPTTGDIQISGPGELKVIAGRNLVLGSGNRATRDGTAAGITSVGASRNPYLPLSAGADILAAAGVGSIYTTLAANQGIAPGLATTGLGFSAFIKQFLDPATAGQAAVRYLPQLATAMGRSETNLDAIWSAFGYVPDQPLTERQATWLVKVFYGVLRDTGIDRDDEKSPNFGTYAQGLAAIAALFADSPLPANEQTKGDLTEPPVRPLTGPWRGNISMPTRQIRSSEGGSISLLIPGGAVTVGRATDAQKADQGILTERGGQIDIFAADSIEVGTSRIFTLKGGDEILWSTWGNIAAGSGSKTVSSAPPTRVLIDPQSADVQNDLAGLATGAGIGALATVSGVKPSNIYLIAPVGTVDAGDAGIRSSGNVKIAARVVLNAANINAGGSVAGTPPPPAAPNIAPISAAASAAAASSSAATETAQSKEAPAPAADLPSIITVEVIGYGGGEEEDDEEKKNETENVAPTEAGVAR